ncbi:LacI family DNA-binding transcriptional regulator, partial [Actinomadura adrarensis]
METFPWNGGRERMPPTPGGGRMAERRSATIKDVAAAAGVGIATVSRVFSGTG